MPKPNDCKDDVLIFIFIYILKASVILPIVGHLRVSDFPLLCIHLYAYNSLFLFNDISTFWGYLMPKPSL